MEIQDFVGHYKNHPVLFIGTGFSLRYLQNSFGWNELLEFISNELTGNEEFYYDLKAESMEDGEYSYDLLATRLEIEFNKCLATDRNGKFEAINDIFYKNMKVPVVGGFHKDGDIGGYGFPQLGFIQQHGVAPDNALLFQTGNPAGDSLAC